MLLVLIKMIKSAELVSIHGNQTSAEAEGSTKKVAQLVAVSERSFSSKEVQTFMAITRDIQISRAEELTIRIQS